MKHPEVTQIYQAYLLRLWKANGPDGKWLLSLQDVFGEQSRRGFENLDDLVSFLQSQVEDKNKED